MKEKIKKKVRIDEKLIFWRVFLIVSVIFLINVGIYLSNNGEGKKVTGFSIDNASFGGTIIELYNSIPVTTRIFIGVQWVVLLLLLVFIYLKDKKIKNVKDEIEGIDLEKASENSKTDLDTLYNLLKEKKQLKISTISKLFDVNEDIVIGWCKTLETSELVTIDYSSGGGTVIKIVE